MKRVGVSARTVIAVAIVSVLLAVVQNAQNKPSVGTPEAAAARQAEAKATFTGVCASCHGLDGRGGERGSDIVSQGDVLRKGDAELIRILKEGKIAEGMPSFASQGPARLSALVDYLRELQGERRQAQLPGDPEKGKALFFGAARCSTCHMIGGRGGFFGSDLSAYAARIGADDVRTAIVDPNKELDPRRGLVTVTLSNSETLTGLVRNQDNFSLQLQTPDGAFHLLNKSEIRTTKYEGKSAMPPDYGATLSKQELDEIVSFLLRVAGSRNRQTAVRAVEDGEEE
jgi:putative heme-binding domain-containing protein